MKRIIYSQKEAQTAKTGFTIARVPKFAMNIYAEILCSIRIIFV